jgi:hypothetical protein
MTAALMRGLDGPWRRVSPPIDRATRAAGEQLSTEIVSPGYRTYVVIPRSWGARRGDLLLRGDDAVRLLYVCGPAHQASRRLTEWAADSTLPDARAWIELHEVWVGTPVAENPS